MKLTKEEIARVLKVAENVENRVTEFCCNGLMYDKVGEHLELGYLLMKKFVAFYGKRPVDCWFPYDGNVTQDIIDARVTLLLFFAEAGKRGEL